jgi:hypothetical protein
MLKITEILYRIAPDGASEIIEISKYYKAVTPDGVINLKQLRYSI